MTLVKNYEGRVRDGVEKNFGMGKGNAHAQRNLFVFSSLSTD